MPIKTALVSVSDKTGLIPFARRLVARGVKILSSGGTAKALESVGIAVETVESYTGSPEVMDGRVKTLHPRVHGGILSRGERDDADLAKLQALGDMMALRDYVDEGPVGKRRLPILAKEEVVKDEEETDEEEAEEVVKAEFDVEEFVSADFDAE